MNPIRSSWGTEEFGSDAPPPWEFHAMNEACPSRPLKSANSDGGRRFEVDPSEDVAEAGFGSGEERRAFT